MGVSPSKLPGSLLPSTAVQGTSAAGTDPSAEPEVPTRVWNPFDTNFRLNFPSFDDAFEDAAGADTGSQPDVEALSRLNPADFPWPLSGQNEDDEEMDVILERRFQRWFEQLEAEKRVTVSARPATGCYLHLCCAMLIHAP